MGEVNMRKECTRFVAIFFYSLIGITLLSLISCGGGGGSSSPPSSNTPSSYSISGTITASGVGLQGVTMTLSSSNSVAATTDTDSEMAATEASSATATTDARGNFSFLNLANGNYIVTPSMSGSTFIPINSAQTINGANSNGVNFIKNIGNWPIEPNTYVRAEIGGLPLVISVPHGGSLDIPGVAVRTTGPTGIDVYTIELATAIQEALQARTGQRAYLVAGLASRKYVDFNRSAAQAYETASVAPVYQAYHSALQSAVNVARIQSSTGALLVDLLGQSDNVRVVYRGTQNGRTANLPALYAAGEFFPTLLSRGIVVDPAIAGGTEYASYNGGYIVGTYGLGSSGVNAVQLAFGMDYRNPQSALNDTANKVAEALAAHLQLPIVDNSAEYLRQLVDLRDKLEQRQISEADFLTQLKDLATTIGSTPNAMQQFQAYLNNVIIGDPSASAKIDTQSLKDAGIIKEKIEFIQAYVDLFIQVCKESLAIAKNSTSNIYNSTRQAIFSVTAYFYVWQEGCRPDTWTTGIEPKYCTDAKEALRQGHYSEAVDNLDRSLGNSRAAWFTEGSSPGSVTISATPGCDGTKPNIWIAWNVPSNAIEYDLFRGMGVFKPSKFISNMKNAHLTDNSVTSGSTYSYSVTARNASGSSFSNVVSAVAKDCSLSAPIPNPFSGSLSGKWSGTCPSFSGFSVSGSFSLNVDSNGKATGSYNGSQSGSINGNVSSNGEFLAGGGGGSGDISWTGNFSLTGTTLKGSGRWSTPDCFGEWSGP